jgi:hypothetical protein
MVRGAAPPTQDSAARAFPQTYFPDIELPIRGWWNNTGSAMPFPNRFDSLPPTGGEENRIFFRGRTYSSDPALAFREMSLLPCFVFGPRDQARRHVLLHVDARHCPDPILVSAWRGRSYPVILEIDRDTSGAVHQYVASFTSPSDTGVIFFRFVTPLDTFYAYVFRPQYARP